MIAFLPSLWEIRASFFRSICFGHDSSEGEMKRWTNLEKHKAHRALVWEHFMGNAWVENRLETAAASASSLFNKCDDHWARSKMANFDQIRYR